MTRPRTVRQWDHERRKQRALTLFLEGLNITDIVERFREAGDAIKAETVSDLLAEASRENVRKLDEATIQDIIAQEDAEYASLKRRLYEEIEIATPPGEDEASGGEETTLSLAQRSGLQRLRMEAIDRIVALKKDRRAMLSDTGLLALKAKEAGQETSGGAEAIAAAITKALDAKTKEAMRDLVMGAALTRKLAEPEAEPEAVPVERPPT